MCCVGRLRVSKSAINFLAFPATNVWLLSGHFIESFEEGFEAFVLTFKAQLGSLQSLADVTSHDSIFFPGERRADFQLHRFLGGV